MKSEIIRSASYLKRYKGLAFLLSLLFAGLGQVYNGDISKGIVFFILRILSLLIIPLYAIIQSTYFSALFFIIAALMHILIWLVSPVEAIYSARGKEAFNLKKYNFLIFYLLYGILTSILTISSILILLSFFSIVKVETDDMNPVLLKDDYIIINKYAVNYINIGEVVAYPSRGGIKKGRIIAKDGETVSKKGNIYYINDSALSYSIFSKTELENIGVDNSEDLFYEINGERKYPVKLKPDKIKSTFAIKPILVGADELFIAFDNRSKNDSYDVICLNTVIGRVEGIIYSKRLKRILNKPYLMAE